MESNIREDDIAFDLTPFFRIHKDGEIERLMGTELVPPSIAGDPVTGVQSKDVVLSPETGVAARLYKPKTTDPDRKLPLLVYLHGGAFFVQSAFSPTYQQFLNSLAGESDIIIVSVDYRLAPEYPLPIAYDDCWAAVKWVISHSGSGDGDEPWLRDYADFRSLFFAGDSAGGNIAHQLGIRVGSEGLDGADLAGIIMMNPYFLGKDPIGIEAKHLDIKTLMDKFWISACPTSNGSDDPWINPVLDPKFSSLGCEKVLIFVAEKDILKNRGWFYYEELRKSGWGGQVEIMEIEGEDHVFHLEKPNSEKANDIVKRVACFTSKDMAQQML